MKPILVVGSGLSGLSTAFWLKKLGIPCDVIEKSDRVGGLLSTKRTEFGLVESAANGFLAAPEILELCEEVGVELAPRKASRKRRYIFRGRPRRWPLNFLETLFLLKGLFKRFLFPSKFFQIGSSETVSEWAENRFGEGAVQWLVSPALQGIYAGNVKRMSAGLVFKGLFEKRGPVPKELRGTLSPKVGMGELIEKLEKWLVNQGVSFQMGTDFKDFDSSSYQAVVLATSSFDLEDLEGLKGAPTLSVEVLPLLTATLFFEREDFHFEGFGCLFPQAEGFYSLGVLFNDSIFEGRSEKRSETWILGGAFRKDVCRFSNEEILRQIKEDRKRLYSQADPGDPLGVDITRWERALPHLNTDLESQLADLQKKSGIFLSGNYLGRIGLSQIVARNKRTALEIQKEFYL
ncbi:MAG: NAD(P)-binding protein [Bdellovibrionales bacterium]|nr:NAD(P)-binding protein [Bdellovibrionales bacterium]